MKPRVNENTRWQNRRASCWGESRYADDQTEYRNWVY
jgi:hypothetical protein